MVFNPAYNQVLDAEVGTYQPPPGFVGTALDASQHLPGIAQSVGMTSFRGSNTILGGGWGRPGMEVGGPIRNNNPFRPRTWTRYGSQNIFFNEGFAARGGSFRSALQAGYTPFPGVWQMPFNWAARNGYLGWGRFGATMQSWSQADEASRMARGLTGTQAKGRIFGTGLLGRMAAAERVGRGGVDAARAMSLGSFYQRAGLEVGEAAFTRPNVARTAILATARGPATQAMAGYMAGLRDPFAAFRGMGSQQFNRGARFATQSLRLGGVSYAQMGGRIGVRGTFSGMGVAYRTGVTEFAKRTAVREATAYATRRAGVMAATRFGGAMGARVIGMANPILAPIFGAWMAYDIAKLVGTGIIPAAARFTTDAIRSFSGGLNRQGFGVPFQTSELAYTSRARGVHAIQNSRLNARSILGSEASGLAGYFG